MSCEAPECYQEKTRKAIKQHKCCECGKIIKPGEKYVCCQGLWDHEWASFKQCEKCNEIMNDAVELTREEGCLDECKFPEFGGLYSWIRNFSDQNGNWLAEELGIKL
jgi:hypothetical protein